MGELYEKENEAGGGSTVNTDSEDKIQAEDIHPETKTQTHENSSKSANATIDIEQTRTNETLSESVSVSSISLNDTESITSEKALESTQLPPEVVETASEQILGDNTNIKVKTEDSISLN